MSKAEPKVHNAIDMLIDDHNKVKELFDQFDKAEGRQKKKRIAAHALAELKVHAAIEEELFYPVVRQQIDDSEGIMDEADEEHHVAKVLIAELDRMSGKEEHWEAKFTVLAENIRHHIKEEENDMLPEAERTDTDFDLLGERMWALKQKLQKHGVPPDAEALMIKKCGLRGDSPAKKATKKVIIPTKPRSVIRSLLHAAV